MHIFDLISIINYFLNPKYVMLENRQIIPGSCSDQIGSCSEQARVAAIKPQLQRTAPAMKSAAAAIKPELKRSSRSCSDQACSSFFVHPPKIRNAALLLCCFILYLFCSIFNYWFVLSWFVTVLIKFYISGIHFAKFLSNV